MSTDASAAPDANTTSNVPSQSLGEGSAAQIQDSGNGSIRGQASQEEPHPQEEQRNQSPRQEPPQRQQEASDTNGSDNDEDDGKEGKEETQPLLSKLKPKSPQIHIPPPEQIVVQNDTLYEIRFLGRTWTGKQIEPICVRSSFPPYPKRGLYTELTEWKTTHRRSTNQEGFAGFFASNWLYNRVGEEQCYMKSQRRYVHNHIVVGVMNKWTGVPRERLVQNIPHQDLFKSIRKVERELRPWWRRIISLKNVQGFSLYECHPDHAYHRKPELDHQTELLLTELFHDYMRRNILSELRWVPWIQQNFNRGDSEHGKPCYALQLVLRWSIGKITGYGLTPVLLSLAIGFWFQYSQEGDRIAVVQTAWTISGFIIAAASILFAIIAAITQIGDV